MTTHLPSIALTAAGAYLTYSGIDGTLDKSGQKSKGFEMAKVALGVALCVNQLDLFLGGEGLIGRVTSFANPTQHNEGAPGLLIGSRPEDFDPAKSELAELFHMGSNADTQFDPKKCDLKLLDDLPNRFGNEAKISRLFELVKKSKGVSCENFLPWKDSFHGGGTGYIDGIRPEDLDSPVKWGIDPWKRPFAAIRHACNDKVGKGAIAYFQRYSGEGFVVSGGHHALYCSGGARPWYSERDVQKLTDLLNKGSFSYETIMNTTYTMRLA